MHIISGGGTHELYGDMKFQSCRSALTTEPCRYQYDTVKTYHPQIGALHSCRPDTQIKKKNPNSCYQEKTRPRQDTPALWDSMTARQLTFRITDTHHVINLLLLCFPTPAAEPLPLMDLCRRAARLALGRERLQEIQSLPLPQSLKNYLQYQ